MLNKASLMTRAREMRQQMTPQERHLWYDFLRARPEHFRRQYVEGGFILDFYCVRYKLAIEVDGACHNNSQIADHDRIRTAYLQSKGIRVLRFTDTEVDRQFEGVCQRILDVLRSLRDTGNEETLP